MIVRWIGWDVELQRTVETKTVILEGEEQLEIKIEKLGRLPKDGENREFLYRGKKYKFNRYGLTKYGEAICVDSYCLWLANHK